MVIHKFKLNVQFNWVLKFHIHYTHLTITRTTTNKLVEM